MCVVALAPFELEEEASAALIRPAGRVAGADEADADAMNDQAAAASRSGALAQLVDAAERAHAYAGRSKSDATIRAYAAGWRDFLSFASVAASRRFGT